MFRTLLSNLVVLALLAAPVNASAEAPQTLAGAVARAAEAHRNVDSAKSVTFQSTRQSRPAPPKPTRGRAMLVGFLVGSVLGGTVAYRDGTARKASGTGSTRWGSRARWPDWPCLVEPMPEMRQVAGRIQ